MLFRAARVDVRPTAEMRLGKWPVAIEIVVNLRRVIGRMRPSEAHLQEERLGWVAPAEPLNRLLRGPVRGVEVLGECVGRLIQEFQSTE